MDDLKRYTRREILKRGAGALSAFSFAASFPSGLSPEDLVIVKLSGGNDALNTVVPLQCGDYRRHRQSISISGGDLIELTEEYGLHPALTETARLYRKGDLAFILGVGFPTDAEASSHELADYFWKTGDLKADGFLAQENPKFFLNCRYVELEGFDTHRNQLRKQAKALKELDRLISREYSQTKTIFIYSEFGRSLRENEDGGTDHGLAGLAMLIGGKVRGGIYGEYRFEGENLTSVLEPSIIYDAIEKRDFGKPNLYFS
ncbi:DUF1501 domain-containing protein [bacterium]|nr:DUF1501 domain-containing protein [bacterium]